MERGPSISMIGQALGYDVIEVEKGTCRRKAHLNPYGTVHGDLTARLLDSCKGLAVQSTLNSGFDPRTVEFRISLMRPIRPETGRIEAKGFVLNRGHRVGTAEGRGTDGDGRLLSRGTSTCLSFES
jgi:uncharacterized protein (TIGR00369 family)